MCCSSLVHGQARPDACWSGALAFARAAQRSDPTGQMRELGCHAVMLSNEKRLLLASLRVLATFLSTC